MIPRQHKGNGVHDELAKASFVILNYEFLTVACGSPQESGVGGGWQLSSRNLTPKGRVSVHASLRRQPAPFRTCISNGNKDVVKHIHQGLGPRACPSPFRLTRTASSQRGAVSRLTHESGQSHLQPHLLRNQIQPPGSLHV